MEYTTGFWAIVRSCVERRRSDECDVCGQFALEVVGTKTADELKKVRYWIDCGDDDGLSKGNCLLHIALMDKGVPHEFRVRDGAHTWTYWRTGIIDGLAFIGQSFHQQ